MSERSDQLIHEEIRCDNLGDISRRFAISINTGGIIATLYIAGKLLEKEINPTDYLFCPFFLFITGLSITGFSVLFAKHKGVKALDCLYEKNPLPDYSVWYKQNFTYEILADLIFLAGVIAEWNIIKGIIF